MLLCAIGLGGGLGYFGYEYWRASKDASYEGFMISGSNVNCAKEGTSLLGAWAKKFKEKWEEWPFWAKALSFGWRYCLFVVDLATGVLNGTKSGWALAGYAGAILLVLLCIFKAVYPLVKFL